jgi:hypothetical protein
MKKYLKIGNILRVLTILMLIWYFNHDGMNHINQIINFFK